MVILSYQAVIESVVVDVVVAGVGYDGCYCYHANLVLIVLYLGVSRVGGVGEGGGGRRGGRHHPGVDTPAPGALSPCPRSHHYNCSARPGPRLPLRSTPPPPPPVPPVPRLMVL